MTHEEDGSRHRKHSESKVHQLLKKQSNEDLDQPNFKRERFLALLKSRYGYTNETAIDELTRLLKQFYLMNQSEGIHPARHFLKRLPVG